MLINLDKSYSHYRENHQGYSLTNDDNSKRPSDIPIFLRSKQLEPFIIKHFKDLQYIAKVGNIPINIKDKTCFPKFNKPLILTFLDPENQ